MAKLKIYRDNTEIIEVSIGDDTIRESYFMGDDRVRVSFSYPEIIDFLPYDYIIHNGKKYSIKGNEMPTRKEFGKRSFEYDIVFKAPEYRMHDMPLSHLGESKFDYFGTPSTILQLVLDCMSVIDDGFELEIDEPVDIEPLHIYFDNVTCRQAVTQACELFGLEYNFDGHVLYVGKSIGNELEGFTFSQGKGKGLYTLTEVSVPDSPFATRFHGFGGSENLPLDYKQGRKNLVMTGDYVERNIDLYGLIVQNIYFDDIYPTRTGSLTSVSADFLTLTDNSIDFDLNEQQIEEAKIVFVSGELGGQEFEITSYNHSTKAMRINRKEESENYLLPNEAFSPKVGDKYKLVGIIMPESYITAAENKVAEKTLEYAEKHSHPSVGFELELDELELRRRGLVGALNVGTWIHVVSEKLSVDRYLRITELSYPIANPSKLTAKISDVVSYTLAERILKDVSGNKNEIATIEREQKRDFSILSRKSAEQARLQAERLTELREYIFDADNYFDSTKIKPLSIETQMLSVGAKSQNFYLSGVTMQPNYLGDPNRFYVSAGQLQHREISIEAGYIWNLSAQAFYALEPNKTYYLSAKCSKANLAGTYSLTETPRAVESQAGYYHFNIGVLYPIGADGNRFFANTSGVSYVVGSQITTGRVKSLDGNTWFDLDIGEIRGKIKFTSGQTVESAIEQAKGEAVAQSGVATQQALAALSVGSRNLLLKSDTDLIKNGGSDYYIGGYNVSDSFKPLEIGKEYTLVIKAKHDGQGAIGIWVDGHQNIDGMSGYAWQNEEAVKVFRFSPHDTSGSRTEIRFYNVPVGSYPDFCIIDWAVLYEGNITTPPLDWTPSPEDFQQQIIDTDNARKEYIDAQDNLKEIEVKAYADGKVSAEEVRAIADATAKANAAKAYADAQDLLLKAQADAYVDGKVSAEEAARITQAQTNLEAAQAYAEAQDNLAKIETKAYADGIVDAEEARAIADAQTKLNEAKLYAEEKQVEANGYALNLVNYVSIGGRNYFKKSSLINLWGGTTDLIRSDSGFSVVGVYANNAEIRISNVIDSNGVYTVSFEHKYEFAPSYVLNIDVCDQQGYNFKSDDLDWKKFSFTFTVTNYGDGSIYNFVDIIGLTAQRHYFRNFKVEKGNKATDWTPAPEDLQQQIVDTDNARKAYIDAQDNLKETEVKAYADGKVSAEEARAIADATAKANAAKAYADAQDLLLKAQTDAYADGKVSAEEAARIAQAQANLTAAQNYATAQDNLAKIETKAYADGIVDAEEARAIADAQAKLNEAKSHADSQASQAQTNAINASQSNIQQEIGALSVGARNLILKSDVPSVKNGGSNYIFGFYNVSPKNSPLKVGQTYTLVVKAKHEGQGGIGIWIDGYQSIDGMGGYAWQNEEAVKVFRFVVEDTPASRTQIHFYNVPGGSYPDFCQVEWLVMYEGNITKPSLDWTPAPEDLQQLVIDADNARKAYVDAQDNLKEIQARAYADGIVDAEEARAIADATAKLNEAKSHADTQASQAQFNAIASSNQNISNAIKALSVGGRNYYRQSLPHSLSGGATGLAFNLDGANTMFLIGSPNNAGHLRISNVINSSGYWVVSGYFRSSQDYLNPLQVDICDRGSTLFYAEPNNKWTYFEVTFDIPASLYGDGSLYNFVDFESLGHLYYYFKNIKVEKGNKATDWTPAPEDIQQLVVDTDNARKSYVDAQDSLKEIQTKAYADGIVSAEEARAIADATAKANAAKAYADNLKVQTDNYVNSITTPIKNIVDEWTYADSTEFDGNKIRTGTVTADKIDTLNLIARHIATSNNADKLTINTNNDNSIKIRHSNGQVGIQMGLIGGVPKLVFYNEYGNKVWEGGMSGIVYVDNVPESWSTVNFKLLPGNHSNVVLDVNGNITSSEKAQLKNWINTSSGFLTTDLGGAPVISSGTTFYSYSAGINAQAENNRVYEGLHTSQLKSTGNWMPNGWYGQSGTALYQVSDYPVQVYATTLEYYVNGKMIASILIDDITML